MASETLDIQYKLLAIQSELKAPKSQFNSFGKYNYRSAEDILENVKPILHKYKTFLVMSDKPVLIGNRVYIEATATLHDADSTSEDVITVTGYAREPEQKTGMDASQITGTASSYARKYALNGLFCIDDTKDADTNEYRKQTTKAEPEVKPEVKKEDVAVTFKTKAECELVVKKFEGLAGEGYIAQESLANMQNAHSKLKSENDYRSFINNCNKNIQDAEKKKAEGFKDDDIPF